MATRGRVSVFVLGALLAGSAPWGRAQPQSPSYRLQQSTANGGGETASSGGFRLDASAGQESAIGTSSSPRFVLQSGFWSFGGSGLVPVLLMARKNGADPADVDLSWSGNNSPYDLYSATDCTDIHNHYLAQEGSNAYTDSPLPADLTCYSVLATAPGPIAPPPVPAADRRPSSTSTAEGRPRHD